MAAIAYESGTLNALVATTTTAPLAVPLSFQIEFAERTRFELVSRFRRLHAFQACLLSHSSISPVGAKIVKNVYMSISNFVVSSRENF